VGECRLQDSGQQGDKKNEDEDNGDRHNDRTDDDADGDGDNHHHHHHGDAVRATPLNIPKWVLCGLYKKSGSGEMRLMV